MRVNKLLIQSTILFLLGGLSTFSLEPYKIYPLIFCFSFAIFFICRTNNFKNIFFLSLSFGFGWFFFGLYWIANAFLIKSSFYVFLMPFAAALLPLFLAFIWSLAFIIAKLISEKIGEVHLNILIILSIVECLRGKLLNFPWLMPSTFFASDEIFIQGFSYLGSYSMNTVFFSCAIIPVLIFKYKKLSVFPTFLFLIPILFLFIKSHDRYNGKPISSFNDDHLINIIQPNIKQHIKWKKKLRSYHHQTLTDLSKIQNSQNNYFSKLNIWPETAFLGLFPRDKSLIKELSRKFLNSNKNEFLFTGVIYKNKNNYYNSAILLNSKEGVKNIYNKNILVPFGEFIPFRKLFPKIRFLENKIDFSNGDFNKAISVNNYYKFVPLICYEVLFSDLIFKSLDNDTSIIVNITNDAWFGDTIGPIQHFQFAKIRAVEFGIPVVRVANTGYSGLISPYGEVLKKLNLNEKGTLSFKLINKLNDTMFKKHGDYLFIILLTLTFLVSILFKNFILKQEYE